MKEERAIDINDIESILKEHYGYKSLTIKRVWGGMGANDMTAINLGPGGTLDMVLDVDDGEEDKNKEIFSFNVVDRIGKHMAKQTQRMDALEWHIKNVEKYLVEWKKEIKQEDIDKTVLWQYVKIPIFSNEDITIPKEARGVERDKYGISWFVPFKEEK